MSAGESREEEALRRLNEASAEGFRRSRRGPGNVTIVVEDGPDGEAELDQGRSRDVEVRHDPPRRR